MASKGKHSQSRRSVTAQDGKASGKPPDPREVAELIQNLPDEQKQIVLQQLTVETTFSGPLPSPDAFQKYDEVLPGAADRIIAMAEKEQKIREDGQTEIFINDRKRINGATLIGLALLVVAGIAAWKGNVGIAVPLGLAGVINSMLRWWFDWLKSRK